MDESGPLTGASALINGEGNANRFDAGGTGEVPVPGSDPVPGRLGADGSVPDPGDVADGNVPVFTGACAFTNDPVVEDDWAAGAPGPLTGASSSTSGEVNGKGTDGVVGLVGVVPVGGVVPLGGVVPVPGVVPDAGGTTGVTGVVPPLLDTVPPPPVEVPEPDACTPALLVAELPLGAPFWLGRAVAPF